MGMGLANALRHHSTWLPVGSKSSLPKKTPVPLKIANDNYVVWQNPKTQQWSVMRDACSHRLAPLSQGRVDDQSGCIECPYHGWQFSEDGQCTRIPQAKGGEKGSQVDSVDVMETGDVIWGRFPIEGGEDLPDTKPNELFPELDEVNHVISRELPYGFDFLVENFMDPAHIPFAHHGLQGLRSDGINIPMKVLTNLDDPTKVEVDFYDRIRGKMRQGVVSFVSPAYYHFRVEDNGGEEKIQLMVLICPVEQGKTRIHLAFIGAKVPTLFPKWMSHSFANQFLETDIWLHNCEIEVNKRNQSATESYDMPTSSDLGARAWRKWWGKHMRHIPVYSDSLGASLVELSPTEQTDRQTHIDTCVDCQKALRLSRVANYCAPLVFLVPNKQLGVVGFVLSKVLARGVEKMVRGR